MSSVLSIPLNKEYIPRFVAVRPESSYPNSINKEVHLLSVNKNKDPAKFGSAVYRIQKYPGDVDLRQSFIVASFDTETLAKEFAKVIKKIVKNILNEKVHFFSEFKAGFDERYDIDIGIISNGVYTMNSQLPMIIQKMYDNKLFNDDEYYVLHRLIHTKNFSENINIPLLFNADTYDAINYIFRERRILRWTAEEILKGKKKVAGNMYIPLTYALIQRSHIKIDMITLINGKYIEVTNFYMLALFENEQVIPINLNYNIDDPKQNTQSALELLPEDIEKLYFSNMYYNPFKVIKRLFALSRSRHDDDMLLKIIPAVSSDISQLYQVKSEIDTLLNIFKLRKIPPKQTINNQVDKMRTPLAEVIEIENIELVILNDDIDKFIKSNDKDIKIKYLKKIKISIEKIINSETILYLDSVFLNPLPSNYLPLNKKYDDTIERKESDQKYNIIDDILKQRKSIKVKNTVQKRIQTEQERLQEIEEALDKLEKIEQEIEQLETKENIEQINELKAEIKSQKEYLIELGDDIKEEIDRLIEEEEIPLKRLTKQERQEQEQEKEKKLQIPITEEELLELDKLIEDELQKIKKRRTTGRLQALSQAEEEKELDELTRKYFEEKK